MPRRKTSQTAIVAGGYIGRARENMSFLSKPDPTVPLLPGLENAQEGDPNAARELFAQFAHGLGNLREADWEILRQALLNLSHGVAADLAFMSEAHDSAA